MKYQLEEVSIELTGKCAMGCIMCSSGSTPNHSTEGELTPEEICNLIVDGRNLGATILSFSGGDPAVLPVELLVRYIELAKDVGYEEILFYTTSVTQSVQYPTEPYRLYFKTLFQNSFLQYVRDIPGFKFVFSLHSYKPHVNDYIMGRQGVTQVIINSIEIAAGNGIECWVHCVPMLPNYKDVMGLRDLCARLGVSKMSLLRFVPQTRGKAANDQLALNDRQFAWLQQTMEKMAGYKALDKHPVMVRFGCPIEFRHTVHSYITHKIKACHAGTDLMLIRPDGSVHPCAAWKTLPQTDNIRDKSLAEIWATGKVFVAIREYMEAGYKDNEGCNQCQYNDSCKGGCPAQRLHWLKNEAGFEKVGLGDLYQHTADPLCPEANHVNCAE